MGGLAQFCEGGSAPGGGDEVGIAATAITALGNHNRVAIAHQVCQDLVGDFLGFLIVFAHHRAHGNAQDKILAPGAMHLGALAVGTALSLEVVLEAVVDQRRDARVRLHHDIAAVAAVASIGTAFGYVRFAAEAHATGTAVAALHVDMYFIDEHSNPFLQEKPSACRGLCDSSL